ncbi:MAG: radical SAM protein [Ilumatobacteraceae bacterium]
MPEQAAVPVIQVHPTRRCNLQCRHCYSSSGPRVSEQIEYGPLVECLTDSVEEGYRAVGFSGGEPLLYRPLRAALQAAQSLGLATTVTSNGMLLNDRGMATLHGVTDLLAISLDGVPASHNRMRGSPRAFEAMAANLHCVREAGIPFGFIFTLTQHNVDELLWVTRFAVEQGAALLQIHPLEIVGRAATELQDSEPDGLELGVAFAEAVRLKLRLDGVLRVQIDISYQQLFRTAPGLFLSAGARSAPADTPLASLLPSVVLETNGSLVPLVYGFAARYKVGNIHDERLAVSARRWITDTYPAFHTLCHDVFAELADVGDAPFFNWYTEIGERAAS